LTVHYWFIIVTAAQRNQSPQAAYLRKIERKKEEIRSAVNGEKKKKKSNICIFFGFAWEKKSIRQTYKDEVPRVIYRGAEATFTQSTEIWFLCV